MNLNNHEISILLEALEWYIPALIDLAERSAAQRDADAAVRVAEDKSTLKEAEDLRDKLEKELEGRGGLRKLFDRFEADIQASIVSCDRTIMMLREMRAPIQSVEEIQQRKLRLHDDLNRFYYMKKEVLTHAGWKEEDPPNDLI